MNNTTISATFMFTDIVGYSMLVNKDQTLAMELLEKHNQILMPAIENNNGRIIKHTGDGYFASFSYSYDALTSAIEFQTKINNRNKLSKEKHRFQIRVGIHTGEAVNKNNDLFGHDVNIASRIEGLCVFGGIAVSDAVFVSLNKVNIYARKMGHVKMKNIKKPLLLHSVYLSKDDWESQTDNELIQNQLKRGIQIVDINDYEIQNTHSIGICCFKTSENEDEERIGNNLTEDIISDFEKISDVRTASKVDVFQFKKSNISNQDKANRLKVNNILDGTLSFNDENMHLNIKMFNTFNGDYIFEENYECGVENSNFLRTKVLTRIMKEFNLDTPEYILESLSRKMTENSVALEKYNKGKYYIQRMSSKEDIDKAHNLFKQACDLDSHFIEALTQYGLTFQKLGQYEEAEEYLEKGLHQAQKEKYDAGIAFIYNYMGILYYNWGKIKASLQFYEKAIELQNKLNDRFQEAKILSNVSEHYIIQGNIHKSLTCLEKSRDIKIDLEETQSLAYTFAQFGNYYTRLGDYSKSFEYVERTVAISGEYNMTQLKSQNLIDLAECYATLGILDDALSYIDQAMPMLEEFDNIFAMGRGYLIRGEIMLNKGYITQAIDDIKSSIEEFEMCDQKRLVLLSNIELAIAYICDDNHKNARKAFEKVFKLGRRIKGFDMFILLAKIIEASFENDKNIDALYDQIKKYDSDSSTYKHWYFLSEAYMNASRQEESDKCLEISRKLLRKTALKNSNEDHQKSMLNNIPLHQKNSQLNFFAQARVIEIHCQLYKISLKLCSD